MVTGEAGSEIIRELGDGLIMRRARRDDAERLAEFHANVQLDPGEEPPSHAIHNWMLEIMTGSHPAVPPEDFLIVEDRDTGEIASSMGLFSQEWKYAGVPVKVGQPELVSTAEKYRRRGLVRAQFEEIHRWSAERGELMQVITGIRWYYRQFGYEMALPMGGSRVGFAAHVPRLSPGADEPFVVRPAGEADIPFMRELYEQGSARGLMSVVRDDAMWRHDLTGRRPGKSFIRNEFRVIETPVGDAVGFFTHKTELWGPGLFVPLYELKPGASWVTVTPSVIRYLEKTGREYAERDGGKWETFAFGLGADHPVYTAMHERLPRKRDPYAWYVRVPDLPRFLMKIAPVLDERLERSVIAGYSGEMVLNFYTGGVRLNFEHGKLTGAEEWRNTRVEDGNAAFPELTFLNILFGRLSLEDLELAFPDVAVQGDEARALLTALFPKMGSNVWQIS